MAEDTRARMETMTHLRCLLWKLRPRIPESLLAGRGWDRLLQRVGDLPVAAAVSLCGFEMKLDDPAPTADFSVAVNPGPVARHYIANSKRASATSTEAWLGEYLSNWSKLDDWLMLAYDIVDVPDGRQAAPAAYLRSGAALSAGGALFEPDWLAATLGVIPGRNEAKPATAKPELRALTRAFAVLPSTAAVVFAAVAPEREPKSIRLVVAELPTSQIESFLDRLEWPGSIPAVRRLLSEMRDVSDRFMIAFDVTANGALPRLGFEMYPNTASAGYRVLLSSWLTTTQADWERMIDRLVEMELCLPTKAEGLLSWPKRNKLYGDNGAYHLSMGINHVKMVIDGERLQAKAYAGLQCYPLT